MNKEYNTILRAKINSPHGIYNPCIVKKENGKFETFPFGHPLPKNSVIVARKTKGGGWLTKENYKGV